MKHLFFIGILLFSACTTIKPGFNDNPGANSNLVKIKVSSNSLLPHKYTLIGYTPSETGNWTYGIFLLPGANRPFTLPVGTKIYRANKRQVGTVMGGGSIRTETPLITVQTADAGKKYPLN